MAGLAFGQDGVAQTLGEEIAERQVEDMLLLEAVALHPAEAEIRGGLHSDHAAAGSSGGGSLVPAQKSLSPSTSCIRTFHFGSP